MTMQQAEFAAVRRGITVNVPIERAFDVYTTQMGTWSPRDHHLGDGDLVDIKIEPRAGGRWYEVTSGGDECDWGRVLAWEPPNRLVLAWMINSDGERWRHDPDPDHASEIEITFTAEAPDSTRVEIVHDKFERHGSGATSIAAGVADDEGWTLTLRLFSEAV